MFRSLSLIAALAALLSVASSTRADDLSIATSSAHAHSDRPEVMMRIRGNSRPGKGGGGSANDLTYRGGTGGAGVLTGSQKVFLIYWGSQWNSNDPSGQAAIQQSFFSGVGGSAWNNSVTQYCQGVASGTQICGRSGTHATNPQGILGGVWYDSTLPAPVQPTQAQLAAEAILAAQHFGYMTASQNLQAQYVINTASGNNASGFGTQYCAWHSYTPSTYGNIAYTNMPYITDAGGSCGANFNGLGPKAGITIVGGHEFGETETDVFPSSGWVDSSGAENGDKCSWISSGQGTATTVTFSTGSFPVQSLWSNAFNNNLGGCVLTY